MDRDLVERARSGDQEAFADLVHQVSNTLFGIARRILRDPELAEDVLQDALVTIWRKLPHLREADRFEGWAYRILVHACYAEAPRNRRWTTTLRELPVDRPDLADDMRTILDRDELERAFRRLPLDQRAVFVLHHHAGLPLVAVAETLGIPDGTARSRLHYATRALRAAFDEACDHDPALGGAAGMSDDREFWRATADWLEAGSDRTPPQAIEAVLLAVRTTRQDRALPSPWRPIDTGPFAQVAIAAVAIVAVALASIYLVLGGNGFGVAQTPIPSSTPSPTPSPTAREFADVEWGALEPGASYVTTDPFPVRITFVAPAGWVGNIGGPYAVFLGPTAGGDVLWFQIFDKVYADPCHPDQGQIDPSPASVDELASALADLPGLDATGAADAILAGHRAKLLTLSAPADLADCTSGALRIWELPLGTSMELSPRQRLRVWILDVDGERLVISALQQPGVSGVGLASIQGVIDSIQIEPSN